MNQETFNKIQTVYLSHKKGYALELKAKFQELKNPKNSAACKLLSDLVQHIQLHQDTTIKVVDLVIENRPIPEYFDLCSSKVNAERFLRKNILLNGVKRDCLRKLLRRQKEFEKLCYQDRSVYHSALRKKLDSDEKQIYYKLRKFDIEIHKKQSRFAQEIEAELSRLHVPFFVGLNDKSQEYTASGKSYILDLIVDHIEGEGIRSSITSQNINNT
ncbi:BA75_04454T0 [Komagataella pastoris]|uniref:BA75_04454T0 n=1 Tax=Komagataella pastoris TaxID=4922 RepID=A0A1B2JJI0_PICPA|nr:BA75_04454T0 [Komagataella pastoris]